MVPSTSELAVASKVNAVGPRDGSATAVKAARRGLFVTVSTAFEPTEIPVSCAPVLSTKMTLEIEKV